MTKSDNGTSHGGFLKNEAELVGVAIRFMDLTIIVLGALIAHYFRLDTIKLGLVYKIALVVVLFGAATLFPLFDLYKPWRGMRIWSEVRTLTIAWLCIAAIVPALVYFTKTGADYSRLWFGSWVLITLLLLLASRLVIRNLSRWFRKKGYNTRNILIVGAGDLGQKVCRNLRESTWTGMKVIGFLDDDPKLRGTEIEGVPVIGCTERLNELVTGSSTIGNLSNDLATELSNTDQVWLALPLSAQEKIQQVCSVLENSAISIIFVPDIFIHGLLNHSVDDLAGMPVLNLRASPIEGQDTTLKLVEDIVISLAAIILASPLLIFIAIAIKFESTGPVLFKQRRYGIDGKEFIIWKFRTMRVMEDGENIPQATKNDPRTTRLGAFLRRTSLDELPQFFNVLQGRMSVVGPRPHAVAHNEQYRAIVDRYMWRYKMKPGITGWAQVNGWRGETDTAEKMEKRVEYDLEYMQNWSIWMDVKIVFQTIVNGALKNNAY